MRFAFLVDIAGLLDFGLFWGCLCDKMYIYFYLFLIAFRFGYNYTVQNNNYLSFHSLCLFVLGTHIHEERGRERD